MYAWLVNVSICVYLWKIHIAYLMETTYTFINTFFILVNPYFSISYFYPIFCVLFYAERGRTLL